MLRGILFRSSNEIPYKFRKALGSTPFEVRATRVRIEREAIERRSPSLNRVRLSAIYRL